MKGTLTFDLKDDQDRQEHLRCVKAIDMTCVLFEIDRNFKKKIESWVNIKGDNISKQDIIDRFFELFNKELEVNNINIDEIIS